MRQRSRETETFAKCIIVAVGTDEELMKHKVHSIRYNLNSFEIDVIYDVLIQNASKRALKKILISSIDKKEADIIILIGENSAKTRRKIYKATNKVIDKIIWDLNLKPLVSKLKGKLKKEFDRSACGIRNGTLIISFSGLNENINSFLTKNVYLIRQIITTFLDTSNYETFSDDDSDNSNKRKKQKKNSDNDNDDNCNDDNNNDDDNDNNNDSDNDNNNDSDNDNNNESDNDNNIDYNIASDIDNNNDSDNDNNIDYNIASDIDNNNVSSSMHVSEEMKKINAADFIEKNSDCNTDKVNSLADALRIIKSVIRENHKKTLMETVNTNDAHGRILAEDIYSEHNVPTFRTAAKHGYAVLASDERGIRKILRKDSKKNPNVLRSGMCMRVKTGAPIPDGATAVVSLKDVRKVDYNDNNKEKIDRNIDDCEKKFDIEILITPQENDNIKPVGYDIKEGMNILQKCTRIGPAAMSILTLCGREKVIVFKVLSVGILSVGDELEEPDTRPLKSKCVYDGNRRMLMSLLKEHDFNPVDYGISPYNASSLISNIQRAIKEVKVLVILGGTNNQDIVKPVLKGYFKANMYFDRVNIKPGKSTALAKSTFENEDKYFFCMSASLSTVPIMAHILLLPFLIGLRCDFSHQYPVILSCLDSEIKLHQRPQLSWAKLEWYHENTFPRAYTPTNNLGHCYNILKYEKSNAILILPRRSQYAIKLFSAFVKALSLK